MTCRASWRLAWRLPWGVSCWDTGSQANHIPVAENALVPIFRETKGYKNGSMQGPNNFRALFHTYRYTAQGPAQPSNTYSPFSIHIAKSHLLLLLLFAFAQVIMLDILPLALSTLAGIVQSIIRAHTPRFIASQILPEMLSKALYESKTCQRAVPIGSAPRAAFKGRTPGSGRHTSQTQKRR